MTLARSVEESNLFCVLVVNIRTNGSTLGVWYEVEGTGGVLEVSMNSSGSKLGGLSVYSGENCDEVVCVASQESSVFPLDWETVEDEIYRIYVFGKNSYEKDEFSIMVDSVIRPANDACEDATELEVNGRTEQGTTRVSKTETDVEFCGEVIEAGYGGVWYTITPEVDALVMVGVTGELSDNSLPFDTQVTVFSGDCGSLTCVDGNDESEILGYSSAVVFSSEAGATYKVLVAGWGESRGDFSIEALSINRPPNNACSESIRLEPFDTVAGATLFATTSADHEFEECGTSQGGNISSAGVWYEVVGSGGTFEAQVSATYDMQLTVFEGECGQLSCVDGTEGTTTDFFQGKVLWDSEAGKSYKILIHGFTNQRGEFEMFFSEVVRPPNDACDEAISLELFDTVAGSNRMAALDQVASCGKFLLFVSHRFFGLC